MSWSVQKKMGAPDKVRVACEKDFDQAAKNYTGTPEEKDVLGAKAAVLAWLDTVPAGMAAIVEASGSRGTGWLSIKVECSTIQLLT